MNARTSRPCRRQCEGVDWSHEPTFMSIGRVLDSAVRLRCPLCLAETTIARG